MKALLIWPKFDSFSFWNFEEVCKIAGVRYMTPPLGLLTVAALLPSDWEVRLVDENVRALTDADISWADLVLVGSKIVHRTRALEIIRHAKDSKKCVVVGGPDPSINPGRYAREGVDFLCLDEGEVTVPLLLADLERGVKSGIYRASRLADLTATPAPRFDLIDHRDYLYIGVQYSRGCPYHCEFCNVVDLFKNEYRTKTLGQIEREFEVLYRLGYRGQVDFFDDNLIGHMRDVKPFLRGIAAWLEAHNYPFQLSTSLTLNVAKDPELLELLRRARFKYFLVGIETPDEHALRAAHKPQNLGFSIAEAAQAIYERAGATIHSGFLLGLDGEADDIGEQIKRCIDEACVPWVMAGIVYPLPGTKLAQRLDREGRLFPAARGDITGGARDQISAGLQFRPERPPLRVLDDLILVMQHAFDPEKYFKRCADVSVKLNTVPNLVPGFRIFLRNLRTFVRLSWRMTRAGPCRRPFWTGLFRVAWNNSAGVEAFVTLSVLYLHFESMLPYCYQQLARQRAVLEKEGEDAWLARNLKEPRPGDAPLGRVALRVM